MEKRQWWRMPFVRLMPVLAVLLVLPMLPTAPARSAPEPRGSLTALVQEAIAGSTVSGSAIGLDLTDDEDTAIGPAPAPWHLATDFHNTIDPIPDYSQQRERDMAAATHTGINAPVNANAPADWKSWAQQWYADHPDAAARDAAAIQSWATSNQQNNSLLFQLNAQEAQRNLQGLSSFLKLGPSYGLPGLAMLGDSIDMSGLFGITPQAPAPHMSLFLANLNNLVSIPFRPAASIPLFPIDPARCSISAPPQSTKISFINRSSYIITVYWVDYLCQEVVYSILVPGASQQFNTYVGHFWRLRQLNNYSLLNNGEIRISNTEPITSIITDQPMTSVSGMGAQASANVQGIDTPGLTQLDSSIEALASRYSSLRERQLEVLYDDPTLSKLRDLLQQHMLGYLYLDPHYLYWEDDLNSSRELVRSSRPTYAVFQAQTAEVASWSTVPANTEEAVSRSNKRRQLTQLERKLNAEVDAFYVSQPEIANRTARLEEQLKQRRAELWSQPHAQQFYAEWRNAWQTFYYNSSGGQSANQELEQVLGSSSAMSGYLEAQRAIERLSPAVSRLPQISSALAREQALLNDPAANATLAQIQASYDTKVNDILATTIIPEAMEGFYAEINQLLNANPEYASIRKGDAQQQLTAFRQQVHAAMESCYAKRASDCDGFEDPAVRALIYGPAAQALRPQATQTEQTARFWHTFYTSSAYLSLENAVKNRVRVPLSQIQAQLDDARAEFDRQVSAVPQVQETRNLRAKALANLCAPKAATTSLPVSDPTEAFCSQREKLNRFGQQLGATPQLNASNPVYLPLLIR